MRAVKNIRSKPESSKRILTESTKIITLCSLISTLCSTHASALSAQEEVGLQFAFVPSLSISLSSNKISIDNLTPGNYTSSNTIRINVLTNNVYGYTLTATVGDENGTASSELVNGDSEAVFSSLGSNDQLALSNFSPNYWGYTIASNVNDGSLYSGLVYGADVTINKTMNPSGRAYREYPGTNTTNFTIGASASSNQFSGEYTNVIGFEAIANVDTDIYMQEVTVNQLATLLPNIGDTMILIDERDYNEYLVGKLADGNYWMLDNLALDLTDDEILNQLNFSNTDIDTMSDPEALAALKGISVRDPSTDANGKYATAKVANWASSHSYSAPLVNIDSRDVIPQGDDDPLKTETKDGSWKIGGYYNYCAASAGSYCYGDGTSHGTSSGNATSSICPKGWRMPSSNASSDYATLYAAYSGSSPSQYTAFRIAFHLPLSGYYNDGSADYQGDRGYLWSITRRTNSSRYLLYALTDLIDTTNYTGRFNGFSVRCVKSDD